MKQTTAQPAAKITYTHKLAMTAGSLSVLYAIPYSAQAGVVHVSTPVSNSIDNARFGSPTVGWDVDGNSVADFNLTAFRTINYTSGGSTYGYGLSIPTGRVELDSRGLNGGGIVQAAGSTGSGVSNLSADTVVGPGLPAAFQFGNADATRTVISSSDYNGFASSGFDDVISTFIGFNFIGDLNQVLYGWAEVSVNGFALSATVKQWAYEDSGASIRVGQVSSVPVPPAVFNMLGGLALGAAGVIRGRRQRRAAQNKAV